MSKRWIEFGRQEQASDEAAYFAANEFKTRFGGKVAEAVDFAIEKHGETRRVGGDLYFSHVIAVATIMADEWQVTDEETLVSAVLHDVHEDEDVPLEELGERFGQRVSYLVDGVSKYKSKEEEPGTDQKTLRKVVEYSTDVSVLLIKLADRLHNLRSMGCMPKEKQAPKATETLNAYVEMAKAIGMWEVKTELEEWSFYYLESKKYMRLLEMIENDPRRNSDFIVGMQSRLQHDLDSIGINGKVEVQFKGCRGTESKMERAAKEGKSNSIDYVPDLNSFRVILDEKQTGFPEVETQFLCSMALSKIGAELQRNGYVMDTKRTDDYLAKPRVNGYQALHGVFLTKQNQAFEIAVTTRDREDFNRFGVLSLMRKGIGLGEYQMLKIVFTPEGKVKFLPPKSNGLDVASAIDPWLAMRARGWVEVGKEDKVHMLGELVPHGTQVKIIAGAPGHRPSEALLALSLPETREKMIPVIAKAERMVAIEKGREMLATVLGKRGFLEIEDLKLVDNEMEQKQMDPPLFTLRTTCGCSSVGELCAAVGGGFLSLERVDGLLDMLKVTKDLGWSTLLVTGDDRKGVLAELASRFYQAGINIVQEVNKSSEGKYEIRLVFKDASEEQIEALRNFVGEAGFCERFEIV